MKITAVEPIHLRVPVVNSIADGTQDVLIVLIHTDAGITGIVKRPVSPMCVRPALTRLAPRRGDMA